MRESAGAVRRRHVFFFSGFDPKGAAHYHRLYRQQALRQGALSGADYAVGPRHKLAGGNTVWTVRATPGPDQGEVVTTFEFVRWDDIVRDQWPRSVLGVLRASVRTYRAATVPALRAWPVAPKTIMSLFYPAAYWLLAAVLAVLAAAALGVGWGTGLGALLGTVAGVLVLGLAWHGEQHLNTTWLLRIFAFAHAWATERVPSLPSRLDDAAARIQAQVDNPEVDEVLVVGFSVGSMLAVSAIDRVLAARRTDGAPHGPIGLLTLGHCVPLLGLMPSAHAFRAQLQRVGRSPGVCWVDVSAPGDWGSFALVDPVRLCAPQGALAQGAVNPRLLASPRFHTLFEPQAYALLKKDKRRMHMQYLMAGERPGTYDYFALTAGPLSLVQRWQAGQVS